jgi:hypothetical protein
MTTIKDGTIELQVKVNGKCYASGIELNKSEKILTRELLWLTRALLGTLKELYWFDEEKQS